MRVFYFGENTMSRKRPKTPNFLEQRYLLQLYNKVGLTKSIVIASAIAFTIGSLVIIPVNFIMGGKVLTGLVINLILCCTLLPYHLHQMISLLSELDSMRHTMHEKSVRDELTKAYNRHFLQDASLFLKNEQAEIQPNTSVLLIDLDNFKEINDKHGHKTGDKVLRLLADTCHLLFRSTDIFIRYGGDEFICFLPETNMEQALEIAQRLQNELKLLAIPIRSGKVRFTVSIGVATAKTTQPLEKLISLADKALYKAKKQGKNRINEK